MTYSPRIHVSHEYSELSFAAALEFLKAVADKKKGSVILAAGATPKEMYREFVALNCPTRRFSDNLRFYHLDEFLETESCHTFSDDLRNDFLTPLGVKDFRAWPYEKREATDAMERIEAELLEEAPEVCILGIGTNGHIGFNEPGSSLSSRSRLVVLEESTRKTLAERFGGNEKHVPRQAIAMGIATILRAKKIILVASGEKKAEAVARMLLGPISPACPASFLRLHDDVTIFLDKAAASDLNTRPDYFKEEKQVVRAGERVEGNILFCSPHPDDTSISAGGFLFRHGSSQKVRTVNFYSGHRSEIPGTTMEERIRIRQDEAKEEAKVLNIAMSFAAFAGYDDNYKFIAKDIDRLKEIIAAEKPRHIFLPLLNDSHPAHSAAARLTLRALEEVPGLTPLNIWFYETPWTLFRGGEPNVISALSLDELNTKLRAIGAHRSQVARVPFDYGAEALARLRSVLAREQGLTAFGKSAPELGKHVECFYRIQAR